MYLCAFPKSINSSEIKVRLPPNASKFRPEVAFRDKGAMAVLFYVWYGLLEALLSKPVLAKSLQVVAGAAASLETFASKPVEADL